MTHQTLRMLWMLEMMKDLGKKEKLHLLRHHCLQHPQVGDKFQQKKNHNNIYSAAVLVLN